MLLLCLCVGGNISTVNNKTFVSLVYKKLTIYIYVCVCVCVYKLRVLINGRLRIWIDFVIHGIFRPKKQVRF